MAAIVARGHPHHVETWTEGPPGREFTVSMFRLWCRTDEGKTYSRYVDIAYTGGNFWATVPAEGGWPASFIDTLYRSQLALERSPDTYGPAIMDPDRLRGLEEDAAHPQPSIARGFEERETKDWQDVVDWAADFNLPSDPSNPDRKHIGGPGECWCRRRTHLPHKPWQEDCHTAPICWCRERHCGIGWRAPAGTPR